MKVKEYKYITNDKKSTAWKKIYSCNIKTSDNPEAFLHVLYNITIKTTIHSD